MYLQFKFYENPPSGFRDSARQRFFTPNLKNLCQMHNFKFLKKSKNILSILFLQILHMSNIKKARFNSNLDRRQNMGLDGGDGGYGDRPQNNTSRHFSKTGGR